MPKPSKVFLKAIQTSDSSLIMSSNEESLDIFEKLYAIPCKNCNKEYSVMKYYKHISNCKKMKQTKPKETDERPQGMWPAGLFCYICGREYFSKSLAIHIP